jgi:hypothetical protein
VTVRARQYVLACGAIENSRVLLASNDVESNGIGNRHDNVGRYFMEHPAGRVAKIDTPEPYALWALFQKIFPRSGPPLAPALRLGDEAQRRFEVLNNIVTFKLQRDPKHGVNMSSAVYNKLRHNISPDRKGRMADHLYRSLRTIFHRTARNSLEKFRARTGRTHPLCDRPAASRPRNGRKAASSPVGKNANALGSLSCRILIWKLSRDSDKEDRTASIAPCFLDSELRRPAAKAPPYHVTGFRNPARSGPVESNTVGKPPVSA